MDNVTVVPKIPACDINATHGPAYADAKLPKAGGSWAYVCAECLTEYGGSLGLGKGQKLVTADDTLAPKPTKKGKPPTVATLSRWLDNGMAKATDGCKVEPDGTCQHGKPSWLIEMGMI